MVESLFYLFDRFPVLATFLASILIASLSLEAGFRHGRISRRHPVGVQEVFVRTMVGAMVALMTFTLAVTFWIAATHFLTPAIIKF